MAILFPWCGGGRDKKRLNLCSQRQTRCWGHAEAKGALLYKVNKAAILHQQMPWAQRCASSGDSELDRHLVLKEGENFQTIGGEKTFQEEGGLSRGRCGVERSPVWLQGHVQSWREKGSDWEAGLCQFPGAAVLKDHKLNCFKQQSVLCLISKSRKSHVKLSVGLCFLWKLLRFPVVFGSAWGRPLTEASPQSLPLLSHAIPPVRVFVFAQISLCLYRHQSLALVPTLFQPALIVT